MQRAVNRVQSEEQVRAVTDEARRAGFTSINYDLIYGLSFQTRRARPDALRQLHRAGLPARHD